MDIDEGIVLPITKDFIINGTTDKYGWLSSNEEGIVLASPGLYYEGDQAYDIRKTMRQRMQESRI